MSVSPAAYAFGYRYFTQDARARDRREGFVADRRQVREEFASSMEQTRTAVSGGNDGYGRVHRSYFRVTRWSRLARVAFWVFFVIFLFWALPVFPWGMSLADYSPKVVLALFLLGVCPAVAAIYLLAASAAARHREALVAWSSIYGEATGLRNREFFIERLELQCQLGRDLTEYRVAVILVTVEERSEDGQKLHAPDDDVFRRFGTHLVDQMRPSDLVAAISGTEMAILAAAGSTYALSSIVSRVRRSLEARAQPLAGPGRRASSSAWDTPRWPAAIPSRRRCWKPPAAISRRSIQRKNLPPPDGTLSPSIKPPTWRPFLFVALSLLDARHYDDSEPTSEVQGCPIWGRPPGA